MVPKPQVPDLWILFWIAESVASAAAVKPKGVKILLAYGMSTSFINGKPIFINGPRALPRSFPSISF